MKFGFVDEHRHLCPVRVMCTTLGLSVSPETRGKELVADVVLA